MRYNFSKEFQGLTNGDINRDVIGPEQNKRLREWWGRGLQGAQEAAKTPLPVGIDEKSLRAYHEIARRIIAEGKDPRGTQAARIELIEQTIDAFQRNDEPE